MGEKMASANSPQSRESTIIDPSSPEALPFSHPIDESPELHDPYSELNLFLTRKIKEEFKNSATPKKWSVYVQEKLIEKISPEFKSRFPHYRLGVSALKKIWEKVAYFSQAFESQKEALTSEGKLNIGFLIRENLKQFLSGKKSFSFHPYLLAQQLALKISECLAAYDGIRPMLQHITKTIWAVERHLIPPIQVPALANPYDEFDTWDKLIIKFMLEASGKNPHLSQEELQSEVRQALYFLKDLPGDHLQEITELLAEKLFPKTDHQEELLAALSLSLKNRLENEIINILIDHPEKTLPNAIDMTVQFFKKAQALASTANWIEIEHKITFWTIQGDLVYRCLKIEDNRLLEHIRNQEKEDYLCRYPFLAGFGEQTAARARILSKFIWYAQLSTPSQSTVERFFRWHLERMTGLDKLQQLEELCKKQLPLLPFDRKEAHQINTQKNERYAEQLTHR